MNQKHYIGKRLSNFELLDEVGPVTGVALLLDDENEIFVGDDTGYVLEIECPYGTDSMARNILSEVSGRVYKAYQGSNAILSPAAELGDGVTVNGVYSMLADRDIVFGPGHMSDVSAPGESTLQHEYPYIGTYEKKLNRKIAQTRSLITKTAEEIRLEVFKEIDGIEVAFSELELTVDGLVGRVGDAEGNIAELEFTVDGLTVTDETGTTRIKGSSVETDSLVLTGKITFADLDSDLKNMVESGDLPDYIKETYIDSTTIQSPTITGGKITGGEIFGGKFSDLPDTSYLKMDTSDDGSMSTAFLQHMFPAYSTTQPLMAMGYGQTAGITMWMLLVQQRAVLTITNGVVKPNGTWDFSNATVTGI